MLFNTQKNLKYRGYSVKLPSDATIRLKISYEKLTIISLLPCRNLLSKLPLSPHRVPIAWTTVRRRPTAPLNCQPVKDCGETAIIVNFRFQVKMSQNNGAAQTLLSSENLEGRVSPELWPEQSKFLMEFEYMWIYFILSLQCQVWWNSPSRTTIST